MNGKQRVKAAMTFGTPDRLPLHFESMGMSDYSYANWNQIGTGDHMKSRTVDEWGCTWARSEVKNMGLVIGHPLDDWGKLATFRWPDPDDPAFYAGMDQQFEGSDGKFVQTGIFMVLFERMHSLRGFQNTLEDLYLERENIEVLADRIVEFDLRIIRNIGSRFPGMIDGIGFSDDWGTELNTFISVELFREFFAPRYRAIFDACHENGWLVTLHSCGKVNRFLDTLIEVGTDCVNLQQPTLLGIEEVGRQFAGRICFDSVCDIQHTLPFKGREEIRAEAKRLIDCWGTPKGGFVLGDYGDGEAIGVTLEKKKWMLDAFLEYDRWIKPSGDQAK